MEFSFRSASALVAAVVFASSPTFFGAPESPAPSSPPAPQVLTEVPPQPPAAPPLTEVFFKNLKARAIGPAVMGGRVSDIAIDPRNPGLFYVGLATGGVFKTGDAGTTFDPIFDKESSLSIGAVAIAPSDSDVL